MHFRWHIVNKDYYIEETTYKITKLTTNTELMFRVTAENEVGRSDVSNSTRYVRICTPKDPEPAIVVENLKDLTVGLGKRVVLSCVVRGVPKPEIKW